ncbi:MAG: ABC transporter ATP-binding protein [Nitrospirae bacterium]|nr:ABC transporter ATP-binding protein [Nitrospirota bacterium]MBI3594774.1 ABC transporter ATP-binding protein [Nitrospirota bacterium]
MIIKVENLVKRFKNVVAVNSVSFEVEEGAILGLLGPNGAGKTTLMAMILGILTPTSGTITLFGKNYTRNREAILSEVNFSSSYVSMPLSLTLRENLTFFARIYHVKNYPGKISDLLKLCELTQFQNRLTRELSTGQLSRLNLAKALLNRPRILFLDEPTASLDPDMAEHVREILMALKKESGCTIVYTSHNMQEIETISDRILFMNRGEVIADGTPLEVIQQFKKDTLEEVFLKLSRETVRP